MTTRTAEFVMAVLMGLLSIYLMVESAKLPIGWEEGRGPGGGAWPFWLSAGMLICCLITLVRWKGRKTPESRADSDEFMDSTTRQINFVTIGSLVVMLALTHVIGMYLAMILFLFFYIRFVGRHSWWLTTVLAIGTPIFMFFFFEALLKIGLPKGLSVFEPMYYPLYDFIY